jgi:cytoplasmic iron level regulating protein YaaA (DUF328/UPF0246 family)
MRADKIATHHFQQPSLLKQARQLANYVKTLAPEQLATSMALSATRATQTHKTWHTWKGKSTHHLPAIDSFIGDIYSGLQVQTFTKEDRTYANNHLFILSGLYGVLRALDSIAPYRLEMGYKLPEEPYRHLYAFWGNRIAKQLPKGNTIINLSAVEYTKAVLPYMSDARVITPKFMTMDKAGKPNFVTVHAKVARGAFARWLIQKQINDEAKIKQFTDLNYRYNDKLSTPEQPVFICETFGGIGLSIRLLELSN